MTRLVSLATECNGLGIFNKAIESYLISQYSDRAEMMQDNEQLLLLILEWLDAADLMAFDTATQSNRLMSSTWLRVIRSHVDIRPMRGLLYTPVWIRWLIDRGVRTSSMRIAGCTITDRVTDATFEGIYLPELTSIEVVGGACRDLGDGAVRLIATGCVNLLNIELVDCHRMKCHSLATVGQHCKALISLDIRKCIGIEDEGVKALAQGCKYLQSLNISQCWKLTDTSLAAIGETCKGLTSIDVSGNYEMTDVGISSLTEGCSQLQSINIGHCYQLTDASLAAIGKHCKGLTSFSIYESLITDSSIVRLTQGCRYLQSIDIYFCYLLTDVALVAIGKKCRDLKAIEISGNDNFTDFGVEFLKRKCCALKTISRF